MATDFNPNNTTIVTSGAFRPSVRDLPLDIRTRISTIEDMTTIPMPYIGMMVYVIDEKNIYVVQKLNSTQTKVETQVNGGFVSLLEFINTYTKEEIDYIIDNLTILSGEQIKNIDKIPTIVNELAGLQAEFDEHIANHPTGGSGLTQEQLDKLNIAHTHSQQAHAPVNAEENVQSDWNIADINSDAYIKNKPTNLATTEQITPMQNSINNLNTKSEKALYFGESIVGSVDIENNILGKMDKIENTDIPKIKTDLEANNIQLQEHLTNHPAGGCDFDILGDIPDITPNPQPIPVTGVALNKSTTTVEVGSNETLIATVSPSNATNKGVTWSSSNPSIAGVNSSGRVSAYTSGTAIITATTQDGNKTASCTVNVPSQTISVTDVTLNKNYLNLRKGESEILSAMVAPISATNKNVTWASNNSSIAGVDSSGRVSAYTSGTTTVTVTTVDGNKTATCNVIVAEEDIETKITLNKTTSTLALGSGETLNATLSGSLVGKNVTWSSADDGIVFVDNTGTLKAIGFGTTKIKATVDDVFAECVVNVIDSTETKPSNTVYVSETGSDTTGDGTSNKPYRTISKAISLIDIKTTYITIKGEYHIGGSLNGVYLKANKGELVEIQLTGSADFTNCTFDNVSIVPNALGGTYNITGCTFKNNAYSSLFVKKNNITLNVSNCRFKDTLPNENEWIANTDWVRFWRFNPVNIYGSSVKVTLTNNIFSNNMSRVLVYFVSGYTGSTLNATGNIFTKCEGNAICFESSISGNIENNYFTFIGALRNSIGNTDEGMGVGGNAVFAHNGNAPYNEMVIKNNHIAWVMENGIEGGHKEVAFNYIREPGYRLKEGYYNPSTEGIWGSAKNGIHHNTIINPKLSGIRIENYGNAGLTSTSCTDNIITLLEAGEEGDNQTGISVVVKQEEDKNVTVKRNKIIGFPRITRIDNNGFSTSTIDLQTTSEEPTPSIDVVLVTGVSLNKTSHTFTDFTTLKLSETVSPSNATNKNVAWESSDTTVATVSSVGLVTAKANGSATITCTTVDGNKTATCTVTVQSTPIPVTGVTINKTSLSLKIGGTETLSSTVLPSNATNKSVFWTSGNNTIATVSGNGLVSAKAKGSTTISVNTVDGGKIASCSLVVEDSNVEPPITDGNYFDINNTLIEEKGCSHTVNVVNKTINVSSDFSANYYGYLIWDISKIREGRRYRLTCKCNNSKSFVRFRVDGVKDVEEAQKTEYSLDFVGVNTQEKIVDMCFGIRQLENIGTITAIFSDIKIIDLDGDPPELPKGEITYAVVDYKIIVSDGTNTESYHSCDDIPRNLNGQGGVDGYKMIIKDRIKHYLSLTKGTSSSKLTIDGMKPFNYSLIDQAFKGTWSNRGYAVANNTLKYTIANRVNETNNIVADDRPVNQKALDRALSIYNCAIPEYMQITQDQQSINSVSEASFEDTFLGICRLHNGERFHIHQNTRLLGGGNNASRMYVAILVHELGHTTGIWDNSPHYPTTYTYLKDQQNEWLQPSDIAHIKDKFPHLTGVTRTMQEVEKTSNNSNVIFSFKHYKNENEMLNDADKVIIGAFEGIEGKLECEGLNYILYKFKNENEIVTVKIHESIKLGLIEGCNYKMYLNSNNYLLNPNETIREEV